MEFERLASKDICAPDASPSAPYEEYSATLKQPDATTPIYLVVVLTNKPVIFGSPAFLTVPLVVLPCKNLSVRLGRLKVVEPSPLP